MPASWKTKRSITGAFAFAIVDEKAVSIAFDSASVRDLNVVSDVAASDLGVCNVRLSKRGVERRAANACRR